METEQITIDKRVSAIVRFGPPTETDGFRPGEYGQCIIDPNMCSPMGDYIRFDQTAQGGELHGWQRVKGITVCEILGDAPPMEHPPAGYEAFERATVTMRAIVRGE